MVTEDPPTYTSNPAQTIHVFLAFSRCVLDRQADVVDLEDAVPKCDNAGDSFKDHIVVELTFPGVDLESRPGRPSKLEVGNQVRW